MKSTGIVRKIDALGRVVVPKEMRDVLGIEIGDPVDVMIDGGNIIMRKYCCGCYLCGFENAPVPFKGKFICADCVRRIGVIAGGLSNVR